MLGTTLRRVILVTALIATTAGLTSVPAAAPPDDGDVTFTACMRAHGHPGFPQVAVSADGLVNFDIRGESIHLGSPKYGPAFSSCERYLPRGGALPGGPPAPPTPPVPPVPA